MPALLEGPGSLAGGISILKTEVIIPRHPNNPYPVYQLFINAENYSEEDLLQAYEYLSNADKRIKSGGDEKQLVMEEAILNICRRKK